MPSLGELRTPQLFVCAVWMVCYAHQQKASGKQGFSSMIKRLDHAMLVPFKNHSKICELLQVPKYRINGILLIPLAIYDTYTWDEFDDDSEVVSSFGAPGSEVTKQNLEKQTTQYVWGSQSWLLCHFWVWKLLHLGGVLGCPPPSNSGKLRFIGVPF